MSILAGLLLAVSAVSAAETAVAWKPFDGRKGHLAGYRLSDGDLFMQTVIVCRFDPEVRTEVVKDGEGFGAAAGLKSFKVGDALCRIECVNVPVKPVSKKIQSELKKSDLGYTAIPGFPWYADFGLSAEPENADGKYPFYYVVGADGTVKYSGGSVSQAISAAKRDAGAHADADDKLLGPLKVAVHTDLAGALKFGSPVTPVVKKLKAIAAGKTGSDERKEAEDILKMLEQSKNYWYKTIAATDDPGMKVVLAGQAMKTFPADKRMFEALAQKALSNPVVAKAIKMYQTLYSYRQNPPQKKADIMKAHKLACQGEKVIAKFRKDFGDKLPAAFLSLENLVMEVKAEMEAAGAGRK